MPVNVEAERAAIQSLREEARAERLVGMLCTALSWLAWLFAAGSCLILGFRMLVSELVVHNWETGFDLWWMAPIAGGFLLWKLLSQAADRHHDDANRLDEAWRLRDRALREALRMPPPLPDRVAARVEQWIETHPESAQKIEKMLQPEVGSKVYLLWRLIRALFGGG